VQNAVTAYLDTEPAETAAIPLALPDEFNDKIKHHGSVLRQSFTPAKSAALRHALWACKEVHLVPKGVDGQGAFLGLVKDFMAQLPAPSNLQVHLQGPALRIQWSGAVDGVMGKMQAYLLQRSVGEEPGAWEDLTTTTESSHLDTQDIVGVGSKVGVV